MEFLNIESDEINLIISYESQNVEKLKCKASNKMEDILSAFAQKKNADYSSFLILYSGKELQGSDLKKTIFQTMTKIDKEQKTMNLLIYSKNSVPLSRQNFIKIILIINSRDVYELHGKKDESIKDILNKNISKIGKTINSLTIKYNMNEIDLDKKFDEIADDRDKKFSGMTLSAYTNDDNHSLKVVFIDIKNREASVGCKMEDKIRNVVKDYCLMIGRSIKDFSFKYETYDVHFEKTFNEYFNYLSQVRETNDGTVKCFDRSNSLNEIEIRVFERVSCFKKYKKRIIIISIVIFILLVSAIITYLLYPKTVHINPPIPITYPNSSISNCSNMIDTDLSSDIINDTNKQIDYDSTKQTYISNSTNIQTDISIKTTIIEDPSKSQSQSIIGTHYIPDTIRATYEIIYSFIVETYSIIDTTKVTDIISNTIKKSPKICDEGYFLPDNDETLEDCQKCSLKGCAKCHGSYENNICIDCGNLKSIYNVKGDKIIGCVEPSIYIEDENCQAFYDDKLGCKDCNVGYKLVNDTCRPDFFIKAIYKTEGDGDILTLFKSSSHVNKLIIDGENFPVINEYQFPKKGYHTVYIKFEKSSYCTSDFFYNNKKLISIFFSDFDEYIPGFCFQNLFKECTNLTSVDLSRIAFNLNLELKSMFSGCTNLRNVTFNLKKTFIATSVENMFLNCKSLISLDLGNFNVSKIIFFTSMFEGCTSLRKINLKSFKLDSVKSINYMFKNCFSLEYLDLSFFKPFKLLNMDLVFYNCYSLTSINFDEFHTSLVNNMKLLFYNCSSLKFINLTSFNTETVTNMEGMFERCTSLTSIMFGSNFKTNEINRMGSFLAHCHSLKSIDYPLTITRKLGNLTDFFSDCYSLTSINIDNFDTSNIYYYRNMFRNCYSLKNINISKFKFVNGASIYHMFNGCYSLTSIDFSNCTHNRINYEGTFFNCPNLNYIDFSFAYNSAVYTPLFNSNISSNGTLILNRSLYNSQKKYMNIPSNWTVKLI